MGFGAVDYTATVQALAPQFCPSCPASLPLAVMQLESSGNPAAVSSKGAVGLFQLMPATAAGLHVNPSDPTQNIQGGLTYLQQLYNQFGDWKQALEAYNEGPGALQGQIAAGAAPTSEGYAAAVLSAAGMPDDSADAAGAAGASDASAGFLEELGSGGGSGVSWGLVGGVALAIIGAWLLAGK